MSSGEGLAATRRGVAGLGHDTFITNLELPVEADQFHRRHAVVELADRDLERSAELNHVPSGNFHTNSACRQWGLLATT